MQLFHTSGTEIDEIDEIGTYGEFLCFSSSIYVMTGGDSWITYSIEIEESDVIEARELFYHEDAEKLEGVVAEVMEMVGCDEDEAEDLLSEKVALVDIQDEFDGEMDWEIQRLTAKCAKTLGYRAVECTDEQGAMWMVDMLGREEELVIHE